MEAWVRYVENHYYNYYHVALAHHYSKVVKCLIALVVDRIACSHYHFVGYGLRGYGWIVIWDWVDCTVFYDFHAYVIHAYDSYWVDCVILAHVA